MLQCKLLLDFQYSIDCRFCRLVFRLSAYYMLLTSKYPARET